MFPAVAFVGLTVATIFKHSRQRWRFTTASVFIVFITGVLALIAIKAPISAALGIGIVLMGIPVWLAIRPRLSGSG